MRAAVALEPGSDTVAVVEDLEVHDPGPGEVAVRVRAAGICHSDLSGMDGTIPQRFPFVPGHEGAGEVAAVGPGVGSVHEGDHVIVAWTPPCGRCKACLRGQPNLCVDIFFAMQAEPGFRRNGEGVFGFAGTGTWTERVVLPAEALVVVPSDVPFEVAALIGCGVTTGVGCGGVGVSAMQGGVLCGAAEIVGVDTVARKFVDALRFGARIAVAPEDL